MNKSEAKYAATSADLITQFVKDADDEMISEFCSRFEILIGKENRKKAEKMAQKLSEEFLSTKEAQKSGGSSVNKDSPPTAADVSVFGTKSGTKQFTIDNMLAMGTHTLVEIEMESGASMETVKRRIRKLKSLGVNISTHDDGKLGIKHEEPVMGAQDDEKKKRKRRRKK